ncbi:MAG: DUF4252 domain-containing protein [Bacteroides sp.]
MRTNYFILTLIALMLALGAKAQNKLFDKYSDMRNVSSVYISKAMLSVQTEILTDDVNIGKVANELEGIYIISTLDKAIKTELRKDIQKLISNGKYELLMKQKGTASNSAFYIQRKGEKIRELIMVMDGAASLRFIALVGNLSIKDIQNITKDESCNYNYNFPPINFEAYAVNIDDMNIDLSGLKAIDMKDFEGLMDSKSLKELKELQNIKSLKELKKFNEKKRPKKES